MLDLSGPLVLDGGLSTALEQQGADLGGALWTARLLADEPARIAAAHRSFFDAGRAGGDDGELPGQRRGPRRGRLRRRRRPARLIASSVTIAREVADELTPGSLVAASVGPYGAYLADGSEYTGRYGVSAARLRDFHGPRLELLAGAGPDLFAVETIPDADEAEVLVALLDEIGLPAWFSYSVRGDHTRAGQPLDAAYAVLIGSPLASSPPASTARTRPTCSALSRHAVAVTGLPAVAYPNRGGSWDAEAKRWAYGDPLDLDLVAGWLVGRGPPGGRLLRQRSGRHRGPGGKCRRHTSWVDCAG